MTVLLFCRWLFFGVFSNEIRESFKLSSAVCQMLSTRTGTELVLLHILNMQVIHGVVAASRARQHAKPAVCLLDDAHIMRHPAEQVQHGLDPAECSLWRCQDLQVAQSDCGGVDLH